MEGIGNLISMLDYKIIKLDDQAAPPFSCCDNCMECHDFYVKNIYKI